MTRGKFAARWAYTASLIALNACALNAFVQPAAAQDARSNPQNPQMSNPSNQDSALQGSATTQTTPSATVVVTGKTPEVVHKIDRSVYDLKDNAQAATGSVSDVLSTLPSVTVDSNGNVSVRGASTQVLVDGKPSAALKGANLAAALQSMPANTVAKIEVITNPGAEFHTDAATVINIITRKATGRRASGAVTLNAGTAARYNATVSGEATRGKWSFTGSASLRQDQRSNYVDVDRVTTDANGDVTSHFVQTSRVKVRINMTQLDGAATYAASDRDSLSLNADVTVRNRPRRDAGRIVFLDPASGAVVDDTTTYAFGRQYFNSAALAGQWKHKGHRDGETFTLQVRHEEDENLRDYLYDEVSAVPVAPDTLYRLAHGSREMTDDVNGDYVLPLGQDQQFKAGFDVQSDQIQDNNRSVDIDTKTGAQTVDPEASNRFLIAQTLSSAYVDYQQPLGQWIAEAGLRVEALRTRLSQTRAGPAVHTTDTQWAPSLYLSRNLGDKSKLHFSYSHRIDRPDPDNLNPLDYMLDAQDILVGNPYLRPGQTESVEAGYDYSAKSVMFSGTLYARQMRDTVTEYNYYRHPGDTVLITSYINAGHGASDGLDMSLTLKPGGKFSYSLNSDIYSLSQSAPVDGETLHQSVISHNSKATVTYAPTHADNLQIQALLNGTTLTAQGTMSGANMLNLTWSHTLSPRLKLVATASDVLNSVRLHQLLRTSTFRDSTYIRIPGQIVYFGLNYKLGAVRAPG